MLSQTHLPIAQRINGKLTKQMPELKPSPNELLQQYFGFDDFRFCQRQVIDHLLSGRHAMVVMPTGMGKSLCFQIPALTLPQGSGEICLVLSPLIALMKDQVESMNDRGIDATFVNSSLSREERLGRYEAIGRGEFRLIYVTPERFRKDDFRAVIEKCKVRYLAIDEAHCVSQWGHDFRPDYTRMQEIRRTLGSPVTIALTATATAECRDDVFTQLGIPAAEMRLFHEGIDRPNLKLDVRPVFDEDEKIAAVMEILNDKEYASGQVIVYFSLIKTLQRFSDQLLRGGVDHVCYHGDLNRKDRRRVQDDFMRGDADVVLATNAFGMGVDKEDIRIVIHAETPDRSNRITKKSVVPAATDCRVVAFGFTTKTT